MDQIWLNYKDDLEGIEKAIDAGLDSEVELINKITRYTLMGGGKRLRPLLLVISARLGGICDRRCYQLGSVIEFIHTATLLHDDVLDHAKNRRGQLAARNLYGNQASILTGDFLYTRAIRHIVAMENMEMNYLLSSTCSQMTEGESWQLAHTRDIDLTEARYLKIIEYKTASLFSAACRLGGIISERTPEKKEALARFGLWLGTAFQMADDTLDYLANHRRLGKSLGQDIREGKMTLPFIHLLSNCSKNEKTHLMGLIQSGKPKKELSVIRALMKQYGSIAYAQNKAADLVQRAKAELNCFDDSTHRQALLTIADYAITRDH